VHGLEVRTFKRWLPGERLEDGAAKRVEVCLETGVSWANSSGAQ
jgi:hypothetical protein